MEHMAHNKSNMNVNEQQIKNTTSDNNKKTCEFPEAQQRRVFNLQASKQINKKVEHKKKNIWSKPWESEGNGYVADMFSLTRQLLTNQQANVYLKVCSLLSGQLAQNEAS